MDKIHDRSKHSHQFLTEKTCSLVDSVHLFKSPSFFVNISIFKNQQWNNASGNYKSTISQRIVGWLKINKQEIGLWDWKRRSGQRIHKMRP